MVGILIAVHFFLGFVREKSVRLSEVPYGLVDYPIL